MANSAATQAQYQARLAEFEQLLKARDEQDGSGLQEGAILKGRVIEVQPKRVVIDVGYKAEGAVPLEEFGYDKEGNPRVNVGDEVEVYVDRVEDELGIVILSKEKADRLRKWDQIEEIAREKGVIKGVVIGKVKGGLSVDIGVRAFLPGSQVEIRSTQPLEDFIGEEYEFKIIKLNRFRNNIVLSRRELLEEERAKNREKTIEQLSVGNVVPGVVKNITEYGAFIDLGGIDGLLHITDMSWGRLEHPRELLQIGQEIEVMVLSFERERGRVSLGLKQKTPDPWTQVEEKYPVSTILPGRVVSIADYGVFVELEKGIEGLVHISEMSWTERNVHPGERVKVGDEVTVRVQSVDLDNRRISLSIRETQENPWLKAARDYPIGTVIEGEIKSVTDFGIFIGLADGIDGLVHISDIAWIRDFQHPSEKYERGQTVRAVVTNVDVQAERFSLSMKQLVENPWVQIEKEFPPGSPLQAKVVNKTDFGVFLEIKPGIEGLLHRSEVPGEDIGGIHPGDVLDVKMLRIAPYEQKISLTMRNLTPEEVQRASVSVQSELERQLKEKILKS